MQHIDFFRRPLVSLIIACTTVTLVACSSSSKDPVAGLTTTPPEGCIGLCAYNERKGNDDNVRLTAADVKTIVARAVAEANAQGVNTTLAVVDRVGNVLAVWRTGANTPRNVLISSNPGSSAIVGGLEGLNGKTDALAAISKAITGAYLSSEGNAFSTRTASQIVQDHFNPGELFQPGGPLFGVQFSQLACSDFVQAFDMVAPSPGPHRSPLGLSADAGGFPLYKNGTVVGGVGAISDDIYSLDSDISNSENNIDELVALAATYGYAAPTERRADHITADGKTLRFSDINNSNLKSDLQAAPSYPPANGELATVPGYTNGTLQEGLAYGQADSGIRPALSANSDEAPYVAQDGHVFVDGLDVNRYPAIAGVAPASSGLVKVEVQALLQQGLAVANRARAQIRSPLGSKAEVTISVVDTDGNILGMVRTRDAPIFGADVSLQKARTAAFFSSSQAATTLAMNGSDTRYVGLQGSMPSNLSTVDRETYLAGTRIFMGLPTFGSGDFAFSSRAIGNLARPFYPDGIQTNGNGPLSKPAGQWSPFSTGLQLDLVMNGVVEHVLYAAGVTSTDVSTGCGGITHNSLGTFGPSTLSHSLLANGIQIFPGGVPIYRGNTLIGAIGVSGDGVDQDDMIAFLAVDQAKTALAGAINNAPAAIRADNLTPQSVRLRYVQCPQAPFFNGVDQLPCEGK